MKQYLGLLKFILENGTKKDDRTGIGTLSIFGYQMRFNLDDGFPAVTTKKLYMRSVIHELLWFLSGNTNIQYLVKNNVSIWNDWPFQGYLKANNLEDEYPLYSEKWYQKMAEFVERIKTDDEFARKWGELGPVYGKQWRHWKCPDGSEIDQIKNAIDMIKNNPNSRRIIVSGWNVADIQALVKGKTSPPPLCHTLFQFYVSQGKLSCQLYQRSADVFLGVPFNIASYSLLTMMVAQVTGLKLGEFIHTLGDAHLYFNHLEQAKLQLSREPKKLPRMIINPEIKDIFSFKFDDFELRGYEPHPAIRAPIAV